jgi:hypothetical protein
VPLGADLTTAEWFLLGVGLGTLSATVAALVWAVFGRRSKNGPL